MRKIYTAFIALISLFLLYTFIAKTWLQTDLTALMPQQTQQTDAVLQAAEQASEQFLNQQVILLAGNHDAEQAFQTATEIGDLWRKSQLFTQVDSQLTPDLAQMRADMQFLALATLPAEQRWQLMNQPAEYFQARAQDAANPFTSSLLPLEQDWLGLARFTATRLNPTSRLQWHAETGMLFSTDEAGKTWVWLRATLPDGFSDKRLLQLLAESRQLAQKQQSEVLSTGGAVFAQTAKVRAERESQIMSVAGLVLTFALLWWVFRSSRLFYLALPLLAGVLTGLTFSLLIFGQIHILTLVIGTSLVGLLVDFPLHWLAPAVFMPSERISDGIWRADTSMKQVLPSFIISLAITGLGYVLLWFTPLPVLRQTAVFSAFALLGALGATVWWLPYFMARYTPQTVPFVAFTERAFVLSGKLNTRFRKRGWVVLGTIFLLGGLWRSDWHDDIRQWSNMPSELLAQTQHIAQLSGHDLSGQYLVVEAVNEDALLQKNAQIHQLLQALIQQEKLVGIQSLNQFIEPVVEQEQMQVQLAQLIKQPKTWRALTELGVPAKTMRQTLKQMAEADPVSLSDGIKRPIAQAWQHLYLGEVLPQRFASIIRLQGLSDEQAVKQAILGQTGVHWMDKRAHLNELFRHTRNQALWLKLISYALAMLVLWQIFGKRSLKIIAVPLISAIITTAALGWLGIPISLFAMFGLLLASAVGVDYAVYAQTAPHTAHARLGGMMLAAITTCISFILLSFSGTPAVGAFGITVAIGVLLNLWLARKLLDAPLEQIKRFHFKVPIKYRR